MSDPYELMENFALRQLHAENARLREALGLFRAFVLNNATTWVVGSNHHHPIWAEVAKHLEGFVEPRSGDRWRMVMPATLKTTDAREALKEQS